MTTDDLNAHVMRLHAKVHGDRLDAEDALFMRLLLDDYASELRQLGPTVAAVSRRLNAVRRIIRDARADVERARRAEGQP